jgi:hypothetical protein
LADAELRNRLADGARQAALHFGSWDHCVAQFGAALASVDEA